MFPFGTASIKHHRDATALRLLQDKIRINYAFTAEQLELLAEMTQPEYASLFDDTFLRAGLLGLC